MHKDASLNQNLPRIFAWRRVRGVLIACLPLILLMMPGWKASYAVLIFRIRPVRALAATTATLVGALGAAGAWRGSNCADRDLDRLSDHNPG